MTNDPTNTPGAAEARSSRGPGAWPALSLIVAVVIAAVLQFAAAAKVAHGADVLRRMKSASLMAEHNLPTDFNPADYQWLVKPDATFHHGVPLEFAISACEFLLVVLVLTAHRSRWVWCIVPLVFASFFGYALQRTINALPCGCFGNLWHPPDGLSMTLDAGFVVLAIVIAAIRRTNPAALAGVVVLSLVGLAGGYAYAARTVESAQHEAAQAKAPAPPAQNAAQPAPDTGGGAQASTASTSAPANASAAEKLVASTLMKNDLAAQQANAEPQAFYVFIWDPTCSTCERLKPVVEDYARQYKEEQNPFLQVRLFKKQDLRDQLGIETYEWEDSPSVFVVRAGGEIVELPGGEESVLPDEVLEKLTHDEPLGEE